MPKTSDGDTVICVGRESIEALATGEPVKVGDNEYLLAADSYDHPYRRIAELEELAGRYQERAERNAKIANDLWSLVNSWCDLQIKHPSCLPDAKALKQRIGGGPYDAE